MAELGERYMRILVFFDLPVKTKAERRRATRFRKDLIDDGYIMLQLSVYSRICKGVSRGLEIQKSARICIVGKTCGKSED